MKHLDLFIFFSRAWRFAKFGFHERRRYERNGRGRVRGQIHLSHEHYSFDQMSRLVVTDRDEDGKRDGFGYNVAGELISEQ